MYEFNLTDLSRNDIRFFLCKPNREPIAELHHTLNEKIVMNYGGVGELQLSLPYLITTDTGESKQNPVINQITGDFLIRYDFKGQIKNYYIITNPERNALDDGQQNLTISCYQQHYEWKNKQVQKISGTMLLYDPVGNSGVLNKTLLYKTDWSIDYVDGSLLTKYRTFDEGEKDLLSFIFSAIDSYGSYIPEVDTVNKRLSIYLDENYGRDEGLTIEYGKYLKSLNEKENFNDVITRLYVYGKDELTIRSLNPNGTDYIESLDYYMYPYKQDSEGRTIQHSRYLSDELCEAIVTYNKFMTTKKAEFKKYLMLRSNYELGKTNLSRELSTLNNEMLSLEDQKDILIGKESDLGEINRLITIQESLINNKNQEIDAISVTLSGINLQLQQLSAEVSIDKHFTPAQLKERNYYIREGTWRDSNYFSPEELYEEAEKILALKSQPQVVYEVDAVDIINQFNNPYDRERLKLGSTITIRYPDFGVDIQAKIIVIDHDITNNELKLTIANTKDIKSGFFKMKDLLQRSVNTSTQVDMSKYKWDKSEENNTEIDKILNNAWNANKNAIEGGDNLQYILDRRGLTIKKPDDPNKFLRAVNSVLAITNDGGNTYKNAITWEGITAELVRGELGAFAVVKANLVKVGDNGEKLEDSVIKSAANWNNKVSQGTLYNGVKIDSSNGLVVTRSDDNVRAVFNATDGMAFQVKEGSRWKNVLYADSSTGGLTLEGDIIRGSGNRIIKLSDQGIQLGSAVFNNAPFRVDPIGNAYANTMKLTNPDISNGKIVGTSIDVKDKFVVDSEGNMKATSGKFTGEITGSKITTSSNLSMERRIEMDSGGFRTYDSLGINRIGIGTSNDNNVASIQFTDRTGRETGRLGTSDFGNPQGYQQIDLYSQNILQFDCLIYRLISHANNKNTTLILADPDSVIIGPTLSLSNDLMLNGVSLIQTIATLQDKVRELETELANKASKTHTHSVTTNHHNHGNTQNAPNTGGGTYTTTQPIN